ncbi:hypothetical protein FHG87_009540 [Trinorchestia longiramus]|nr:hypothetical protein FHG87_009540 [Trinorchestia longiramus]
MVLEMVAEEGGGGGVTTPAASRHQLLQLRERNRGQTRLLLATKRRLKTQTELTSQIHAERDLNLRSINSQLLLLEANLRRRQEELAVVLRQKEDTIRDQQRLILALASALSQVTGDRKILQVLTNTSKEHPSVDLVKILKDILALTPSIEDKNGVTKSINRNSARENTSKDQNIINDSDHLKKSVMIQEQTNNFQNLNPKVSNDSDPIIKEETMQEEQKCSSPILDTKRDTDSVTDADSAIMLEDTCSDSLVILPCMRDGVKVIRSVSDALECASRPLQLPPNSILDSASTTPVNSCPSSPNVKNLPKIYSDSAEGSLSTTPSCSSCSEDSDASPSSTLSKARSSSVQVLQNITDGIFNGDVQQYEKTQLNRSLSDSLNTSKRKDGTEGAEVCDDLNSSFADCESTSSSIEDAANSTTYDSDSTLSNGASDTEDNLKNEGECEFQQLELDSAPERRLLIGSYGKTDNTIQTRPYISRKKPDEFFQVTYNRVMGSNHRSVTKVKDVKYKRINKAKSRSLEELRGKLKIREGKPSISMSIGHSYA